MKKFILKLFVFCFITIIGFVTFWAIICSNRDKTLKLPNNENIVFLGNSHIECAVNDSIIKNSFNFARSAENMEYVYCKVKLLKQSNPQLDTVVIGFDNTLLTHTLSNSGLYSPYYYNTYTFSDLNALFKYSTLEYIESHIAHPLDWKKMINIVSRYIKIDVDAHDLKDLGGYLYLVRDKLDVSIKQQNKKSYEIPQCEEIAEYFLKEIREYCAQNNITLIFMHTPMHKALNWDNTLVKMFYRKNYSNIKFYDFRDMKLADSCFGDLDHLNYKGAKVFSEYLEKEVFHKNNYPQ